ncbi:MAG: hypothetical protein ACD_47C00031G0005 [uncultured bacterium]|nr:MAG: hypothetical protein ACD_47C00031G0005 [uncultured bacterium]
MLIFKKGVKIPDIVKNAYARSNGNTFTLISVDGDIDIGGSNIEASLNSLNGTIKKSVDYFQVFGNMTMAKIYFDLNRPGSLFKVSSLPSGANHALLGIAGKTGFKRNSVTYDPALDVCNIENYIKHYKYTISSRQSYWRVYGE